MRIQQEMRTSIPQLQRHASPASRATSIIVVVEVNGLCGEVGANSRNVSLGEPFGTSEVSVP